MSKAAEAFRTISEVAEDLEVPKHVLRFWEAKFPQIRPMKRGGGRRYYRPEDMELLRGIRHLLHAEGYTIKGVQKILREQGIDHVKNHCRELLAQHAAETGPQKRGRKPIHRPEVRDTKPNSAKAPQASLATVPSPPSRVSERRARVEAIIAELDACRRILLADPIPAEVKGAPQRRAAGAGRG